MKPLIGLAVALGALGTGAYLLRGEHHTTLSGSRRRHYRSTRRGHNLRGPAEITEYKIGNLV